MKKSVGGRRGGEGREKRKESVFVFCREDRAETVVKNASSFYENKFFISLSFLSSNDSSV
jgi:hypothetical protein